MCIHTLESVMRTPSRAIADNCVINFFQNLRPKEIEMAAATCSKTKSKILCQKLRDQIFRRKKRSAEEYHTEGKFKKRRPEYSP